MKYQIIVWCQDSKMAVQRKHWLGAEDSHFNVLPFKAVDSHVSLYGFNLFLSSPKPFVLKKSFCDRSLSVMHPLSISWILNQILQEWFFGWALPNMLKWVWFHKVVIYLVYKKENIQMTSPSSLWLHRNNPWVNLFSKDKMVMLDN